MGNLSHASQRATGGFSCGHSTPAGRRFAIGRPEQSQEPWSLRRKRRQLSRPRRIDAVSMGELAPAAKQCSAAFECLLVFVIGRGRGGPAMTKCNNCAQGPKGIEG